MIFINVVVLSGKGGTGKTLVSTNLAVYMKANYIDADVEEPNGFIFLKPKIDTVSKVEVEVPQIDEKKCTKCFKCVDFCEFNALARTKDDIITFHKLCHSCGGCKLVCEHGAITYMKKAVGFIEKGKTIDINCMRGILNIGELIAVSTIKKLLLQLNDGLNIIDSSPGTSCNVVTTLGYADAAILVTEPTKFGLHDLKRAITLVKELHIPFGIIINRVINSDNIINEYCDKNKIRILGVIEYDKKIAKLYSEGKLLIKEDYYKKIFANISSNIKEHIICKLQ